MDSRFILPFIVRFLPPLLVAAMGFYAVSDKKSRQRWAQLLYQAGSLRPEQRDDPKVQNGVRVPFFVLGFLLLFLPAKLDAIGIQGPLGPVNYYFWATAKPETISNLGQRKPVTGLDERAQGRDQAAKDATPTPTGPVVSEPTNPPPPGQPGQPAPAAPGSPAPATNGPRGLASHNKPQ